MASLSMLRGETEVIAVDYAGKAAPWDDLAGAVVQLTARVTLGTAEPAWSTLGAVQGTIAYAVVPAGVTPGTYHVTLSVVLPTGEVDHSDDLLKVKQHAFEDGDDPNVPVASMTSLLAQVAAESAAAAASETAAELAETAAEAARDAALAAQAAAEAGLPALTDRLDGAPGTTIGAGLITAAGSTAPRSAADRAADVVNVKDHGAACDGSTDDTAAINAALVAGAGRHVIIPRSTVISSALTIYSGTWLEVDPGATVTFKAGSTGMMLKNAAQTAQRTIADAAITSGQTTLTSATAAFTSADLGRTVVVAGAGGPDAIVLVANITVVTNGTTVTLSKAAGATVSGASCSIYTRDSNIRVTGGTWARGNASGSGGMNPHTLTFLHVDGLTVSDVKVTSGSGKYSIAAGDVTKLNAQRLDFASASDGIHILGPASKVTIRDVSGTTGDDSVAFTPLDFPDYAVVAGNISDVVVDGVFSNSSIAALVKLTAAGGTTARNLTFRNLKGSGADGVSVVDDGTASPTSPGTDVGGLLITDMAATATSVDVRLQSTALRDVTIRDLLVGPQSHGTGVAVLSGTHITIDGVGVYSPANVNHALISTSANAVVGDLTVRNLRAVSTAGPLIQIGGSTTLTTFNLDGADVTLSNGKPLVQFYSGAGATTEATIRGIRGAFNGSQVVIVAGAVSNLIVSDVRLACAETTSSEVLQVTGTGNLGRWQISNVSMYQGKDVFQYLASATVGPGIVQGAQLNAINRIANINAAADVTLNGVTLASPANAAVFVGNGATATIRGAGINRVTTWSGLQRAGSEVVHVVNPDYPVDLAALAKSNGDAAWNTNAGLACGAGPAVSNGSNWKNVYSGATY